MLNFSKNLNFAKNVKFQVLLIILKFNKYIFYFTTFSFIVINYNIYFITINTCQILHNYFYNNSKPKT